MTNAQYENLMIELRSIKEDCRILRARMISIESWIAALSKGKDIDKSHAFAKDIIELKNRINPMVEIEHCQ